MKRQSSRTKEKLDRTLAERKANRERKIAAVEGRDVETGARFGQTSRGRVKEETKKVYVKEEKSGLKKPRRVFNAYR